MVWQVAASASGGNKRCVARHLILSPGKPPSVVSVSVKTTKQLFFSLAGTKFTLPKYALVTHTYGHVMPLWVLPVPGEDEERRKAGVWSTLWVSACPNAMLSPGKGTLTCFCTAHLGINPISDTHTHVPLAHN